MRNATNAQGETAQAMAATDEGAEVEDLLSVAQRSFSVLETAGNEYRLTYNRAILEPRQEDARECALSIRGSALAYEEAWSRAFAELPEAIQADRDMGGTVTRTDEALALCYRARGLLGACVVYCEHYERTQRSATGTGEDWVEEADTLRADVMSVRDRVAADGYILESRMGRFAAWIQLRLAQRLERLTLIVIVLGAVVAVGAVLQLVG